MLFCLYFQLKEDADVRAYLDWYTTEFPDDSGEVTQLICRALILRRLGREDEALYRFVQAIDENLPAVALLVGDSQAPYGIWGEEVMGLSDMPDEVTQAMSADEKQWLVTSWHSPAVTAMRQRRIALGKDLVVTSEYDKRSAISKRLGALVEAFKPAEIQRYSIADSGSWLTAGRSSTQGKVIKPPPGFWTKVPHEIVVTFTDRGPLRIRYFINRDLAQEVVKRMLGKVIVGNGKSIPTNIRRLSGTH